jgi:hypothetical protein
MEPQWCAVCVLLPARRCRGIAIHFREWQSFWQAISSALSTGDGGESQRVQITPGQIEWEEPTLRVHRAVNVGKQAYEQVTVFLLDRSDAVAQPNEE